MADTTKSAPVGVVPVLLRCDVCGHPTTQSLAEFGKKRPLCTYCTDEVSACDACMGAGCAYCIERSNAERRAEAADLRRDEAAIQHLYPEVK